MEVKEEDDVTLERLCPVYPGGPLCRDTGRRIRRRFSLPPPYHTILP